MSPSSNFESAHEIQQFELVFGGFLNKEYLGTRARSPVVWISTDDFVYFVIGSLVQAHSKHRLKSIRWFFVFLQPVQHSLCHLLLIDWLTFVKGSGPGFPIDISHNLLLYFVFVLGVWWWNHDVYSVEHMGVHLAKRRLIPNLFHFNWNTKIESLFNHYQPVGFSQFFQ